MNRLQSIDAQRRQAARLLGNRTDVEEALFNRYFPLWTRRDTVKTRRSVAFLCASLHSRRAWEQYSAHVRHLRWNARRDPSILRKPCAWLIDAKPWDFCPEKWKQRPVMDWKKAEEEDQFELQNEHGSFRCYRCKSYDVTYTQLQTRSADEGFTTSFYCTKCGNRWRVQ